MELDASELGDKYQTVPGHSEQFNIVKSPPTQSYGDNVAIWIQQCNYSIETWRYNLVSLPSAVSINGSNDCNSVVAIDGQLF